MRCETDDEVYAVSSVWLGPRGNALPWRARYAAYGVFFLLSLLLLAVERRTGVHVGVWVATYDVLGAVAATRLVMRSVDHERNVRSVLATFWHEVTAPRAPTAGDRAVLVPSRVRVCEAPPRSMEN